MKGKQERLQKIIAQSGYTSRRKAERLIIEGKVKVNGKVVTKLGTKASPTDEITVNGIPIEREPKVCYLLYKPRQYITAVSDDRGRKTVIDLMPEVEERIYPIGRLDYHSSGILLLTNDGDFAHQLMHPRYEVPKTYIVKVNGIMSHDTQNKLLEGVQDEGELLKVSRYKVKEVDRKKRTMILEVVLHEGRNRHLRRLFAALGHPVDKLKREKFAFLTLNRLQPGEYRPLTRKEVHDLRQLVSRKRRK
ncbi:MAG TPA: pseudouridine synthase [Pseudogracilibacillus sp.]|nr:pseudouridine synthase [Pseudogracilibacillus sp.]